MRSIARSWHRRGVAYENRLYVKAVELALVSWEYIDGMIRYERRYEDNGELHSISAIEMVLKVSPFLFDRASLERVGETVEVSTTD